MPKRRAFAALLGVGLLTLLFVYQRQSPPPEVELWLGKPLARLQGFAWPRYKDDNQLFDVAWIDHPALIRLHLPSGRQIEMVSQGTWLQVAFTTPVDNSFRPTISSDDIIDYVSLLPLEKPVSPQELVTRLERIGSELQLEQYPEFKSRMAPLTDPDALSSRCADYGFWTEIETDVYVEIRGKTHEGFFSDGCYLVIGFRQEP